MSRPRKPIDPERRATLMHEARAHFATRGYTGASLSEIVAAAGFPRSSFYYFFGDKAALFDAAFEDGLALLARRLTPPDPRSLTVETFWPSLLALVDGLGTSAEDPDLATLAPLFHLSDAPPSPARDSFEHAAREWCAMAVQAGRDLGRLDRSIPADLQTELAWGLALALDRWVATHAGSTKRGAELTRLLFTRVFEAP